jgi:two-component system sensor histidine kinase/response regulator
MDLSINVESTLDEGSKFILTGKLQLPVQTELQSKKRMDQCRILMVSHSARTLELFDRDLNHMGANVTAVEFSLEIMQELQTGVEKNIPYQILIIDQQSLESESLELGRKIRKRPEFDPLKLMILSSTGRRGDATEYFEAGFNGYLNKLSCYEMLESFLVALLNHRQTEPLLTRYSVENNESITTAFEQSFNAHVLLVDDTSANLVIGQKRLERLGITVDSVSDGEQAVSMFPNNNYDLILMDCHMPVMDGYTATRKIRQLEKENERIDSIPIIAFTANASTDDRQACLDSGMNDVLTKPFKRDDLIKCLNNWLIQSGR